MDSKVCGRLGNDVSKWFSVNVRVCQGCVKSPWLFNLYMDGIVREVFPGQLEEEHSLWVMVRNMESVSIAICRLHCAGGDSERS